jgi:hypothetical protein
MTRSSTLALSSSNLESKRSSSCPGGSVPDSYTVSGGGLLSSMGVSDSERRVKGVEKNRETKSKKRRERVKD